MQPVAIGYADVLAYMWRLWRQYPEQLRGLAVDWPSLMPNSGWWRYLHLLPDEHVAAVAEVARTHYEDDWEAYERQAPVEDDRRRRKVLYRLWRQEAGLLGSSP